MIQEVLIKKKKKKNLLDAFLILNKGYYLL